MSALNAQAEAVDFCNLADSGLDHVADVAGWLSVGVGIGLSVCGLGNLLNRIVGDVCRLGL